MCLVITYALTQAYHLLCICIFPRILLAFVFSFERMFLVVNALELIMAQNRAALLPLEDHRPPPEVEMEVAQPLLPVPRLGALVINSFCTTVTLLQYLRCVPNACDSVTVLEELCKRDFTDIFPYLLSLHATHWHKDVLKQLLRKRLFDLSLPALKALQVHIPKLSALTMDETTGTLQPFIGPLSSMVTSQWDTHDWYYQISHAKQMEGKLLFNTISLSLLSRVTLRFVFKTIACFPEH